MLTELVLAIIWLMPPADIYGFFWENAMLTAVSLGRCFKELVGWDNFFLITDMLKLLRRAHWGLSQERVGAGQERENTSLLCSLASPEFPFSLPFLSRRRVPTSAGSVSMRAFSDLCFLFSHCLSDLCWCGRTSKAASWNQETKESGWSPVPVPRTDGGPRRGVLTEIVRHNVGRQKILCDDPCY